MLDRYKIGDWVSVNADVYCLYYDQDNQRKMNIIRRPEPYAAQIVGSCVKMLGKRVPSKDTPGLDGDYDYEPAYLEVSQVVEFWLVRRGMSNKPIMVRDGDCEACWGDIAGVPWKWTNPYKWTDADRKSLSDDVKNQPRDNKGRWIGEEK